MITIGSSDGRKGLGFDASREMEETELEEGEACFYQNDADSAFDPDVALSYLDEKLQHVLGHFQKDFEGGVSAENLGSKFGGYGSFLPTYQRSPAWSHPLKVQNNNSSRSPTSLHLEAGRCNPGSSSASVTARLGSAALGVGSLPALGTSSVNGKREATFSSTHVENKSDNLSDQKSLKVRIKVGSDNLPNQKNAELYSGLGLDVSPNSSLENSPTDSELSREPLDYPDESPKSILEIMTSFPVHGSLLLSPLPDDLICLTEKEKHIRDSRSVQLHRVSQEGPLISLNGSDSARVDWRGLGEKRPKPSEKKAFTMELENDNGHNAQNEAGVLLKKETDLDSLACEEIVSNAVRLPLLSNSYCSVVDSGKAAAMTADISRAGNKGRVKEESVSDQAKDESLGLIPAEENGWVKNSDGKAGSDRNIWEFKKVNSDDGESGHLVKGGNLIGEKTDVPSKADSNVSKGRQRFNTEFMDTAKHKAGQKSKSYDDDDVKVSPAKEHSTSGIKRKSKDLLKKETDLDSLACEEIVSNAVRLPLLSNSYCSVVDSGKAAAMTADISRAGNKGRVKEESVSDQAKDESLGLIPAEENGWVKNSDGKAGSDRNIWEFKKVNSDDGESGHLVKGGNLIGEKTDVPSKADSNVSKGRQRFNTEFMDTAKHKAGQKSKSYDDDDVKVSPAKEHSTSGIKRKSKGSQSHAAPVIPELLKDNMKTVMVSAPKGRKSTHVNTRVSNTEVEDIKKEIGKARDRYTDFFGDLELSHDNNEIAKKMTFSDRLNNCSMVEKSTCEFSSASKERSIGQSVDKQFMSEAFSREASSVVPPTGIRPVIDAATPVAPLVKEDWVCCDECQKWRLLPAGTNPRSLPKIWLCSMLNWLDGMNRCSISEDETTKAVISLNQITASVFGPAPAPAGPEGSNSQNRYTGGTLSGVFSVDALHVDQGHQDLGGKKQHGSKDVLNAINLDDSTPFPNSKKKNRQASVKSKSLNGENQSPSVNEVDFQHSWQSSGLVGEKDRHKKKEKNKLLENYAGEGDTKSSKISLTTNKRETDQDFSKASKKLKTNSVHHMDKDWKSNNCEAALKVGGNSSSGLSIYETVKDWHKYDDHPKDSKPNLKASVRNPVDKTQFASNAASNHLGKQIDRDLMKKKANDYMDAQLYSPSHAGGGHRLEDYRDFREESRKNNHHKEKRARVSKSGVNEISISKGSSGADIHDRSMKDQQPLADLGDNLSRRSLDAVDSVKRDIGSMQPSVAATSSSSKVSGSHKSKSYFQEMKGSPLESVSSSPLRAFNHDKFTSTRRNLGGKSDSQDAFLLATTSPRKCFNGEHGGGSDRSGMVKKDETITVTNHGSLESSGPDFQERDLVHISKRKAEVEPVHSLEFSTHLVSNTSQGDQYPCKPQISDEYHNDECGKGGPYHGTGSRRKSGKGSSRSKDKSWDTRSESDIGNLKVSHFNKSVDHSPYGEKSKARNKSQEKTALCPEKVEKNVISKKDLADNLLTESGVRGSLSNFGSLGSDKQVIISIKDSKQHLPLDRNDKRSSMRFPSDKTDRMDVTGKGKSHSLPPSGRGQNETTRCPQPISGSHKENDASMSLVDATEGEDALNAPKQIKKAENQNGSQSINSGHPTNGHKVRDVDAPSPVRRDPSSQAANNAVKEAKDLKHLADRLKNSGSTLESTGLYFQAALKFLHGASLLESCNSENTKNGEMVQSMQMYSSTAKLCEFCAHEYEKSKDMASAALAYKCVEVAYLRVINSSHASAGKDRHELQAALQIVSLGESPSSSASDVDNLNNPVTADKVPLAKGVSSPQVAGNHVIPARNRPNFVRLLNLAQDVNFAMEASRKSRIVFAAADSRLEETKYQEGMSSVKKALDFNFQDVEGLLRLVRLAMEAISH